jgi:hypothetical protein
MVIEKHKYFLITTTLYMITSPSVFFKKIARLPQKKFAWEKTPPTQKFLTTQHFQKMGSPRKNEIA